MATTLDISTDYLIWDNYQTVTITNKNGDSVSSVRAVKETVSQSDGLNNQFHLTNVVTRWHVGVAQLGTFVPAEHGYITDEDGAKHYIDEGGVSLAAWDTRFELSTTMQAGLDVTGA